MSLNWKFSLKIFLIFALIIFICNLNIFAQSAKFKITPYLNGISSISEGFMEVGPEIKIKNFSFRPLLKFALADKKKSIVQLDQKTESWGVVFAVDYNLFIGGTEYGLSLFKLGLQVNWGSTNFTYYPAGNKDNEAKEVKDSLALEFKSMYFFTKAKTGAVQFAPQLRVKYGKIWEAAKEVGIITAHSSGEFNIVKNMRVDPPKMTPVFSIGAAFPFYLGSGNFGYAPALFFNWIGKENKDCPFKNIGRIRVEGWFLYMPKIKNMPNVRIGIAPFVSVRTMGDDKLDEVFWGAILQLKISVNWQQLF